VPVAYRIEPLGKHHERDNFRCGIDALDRYLQQQARQEAEKHVAAPFVLVHGGRPDVLGYYTLSASAISACGIAPALARKLPRYQHLPVTLIGRLAVDVSLEGQGRGAFLIADALRRSLENAVHVAAMAVVVHAKNDIAAAFYRHIGFQSLQTEPQRLYLPMKTVATLVG
jgi:GNAT superfamily N-acetyltransferase